MALIVTDDQLSGNVPFDEEVESIVDSLLTVGQTRGEDLRRSRLEAGGGTPSDRRDISQLIRKGLRGALLDLRAVRVIGPPNADPSRQVASGYLIGNGLVLTVGHVGVRSVASYEVRTLEGTSSSATIVWQDAEAAAVLLRTEDPLAKAMPQARLGRLAGRLRVPFTATGFPAPAAELREDRGLKAERVEGELLPGDAGDGVRLVSGQRTESRGLGAHWGGMGGAGVVCGQQLLGILAASPPRGEVTHWSWIPITQLAASPGFLEALRAAGANSVIIDAVETQGFLEPAYEETAASQGRGASSYLLSARYGVVPFRSRTELDQLAAWSRAASAGDVAILVGPAGTGKTRLARELCANLASASGWITGLLARDAPMHRMQALNGLQCSLLIVVDYAETRIDDVAALIIALSQAPQDAYPRRLLLIARQLGDWWAQLRDRCASDGAGDLLAHSLAIELGAGNESLWDREKAYDDAFTAFSQQLDAERAAAPAPDLSDKVFETPLFIHMAALSSVVRPDGDAPAADSIRADLLARALDVEERYWSDSAQAHEWPARVGRGVLRRAVAIATLVSPTTAGGPVGERETTSLLEVMPELRHDAELRHRVAAWLHDLYPTDDGWIAPLEPDLLGEALVADTVAGAPGLARDLLGRADGPTATRALTVLARAARHHESCRLALADAFDHHLRRLAAPAVDVAQQLGDPIGLLLATALERHPDREVARELLGWIPKYTVSLREVAAVAASQALEGVPRRSRERADLLVHKSNRLSELGRREEALGAINEAVSIRRALAAGRPDAFMPSLATSLNNQSALLNELGRREDALRAIDEAVSIRRGLAARNPDAFLPSLATSLNNQSALLSELGRREEALSVIGEAVTIGRRLADGRPDAFLPSFATSLNNRSTFLGEQGRYEEALIAIEEAVRVYRGLADGRPDAFLPGLAASLNNQSNRLSDLGRVEEALVAIDEAVRVYRGLADGRPDAFLPGLAASLNNQSTLFGELGRVAEALTAIDEAVHIRRALAGAHPAAFLPDLAISLNNQSGRFSELGRGDDALTAIEEAISIRRALAEEHPDAFLPSLAASLGNQSNRMSELGRREDALAAIDEAVQRMLPMLERAHHSLAQLGLRLFETYVRRSAEAEREPDEETARRMLAALAAAGVTNADPQSST